MNATIPTKPLVRALRFVTLAAEKRKVPHLVSCVFIAAHPGAVVLSCSDYDVTAVEQLDAETATPGSIGADARELLDAVRACKAPTVTLEVVDGRLQVTAGAASRFVSSMLPGDFAEIYPLRLGDSLASWSISGPALRGVLGAVEAAQSTDVTRPSLCGVYLEGGERLRATATDGWRIHTATMAGPAPELGVIVPRRGVALLLALSGDAVQLDRHPVHLSAVTERRGVSMRFVDESYPDWRRVLPQGEPRCTVQVEPRALVEGIKAIWSTLDKGHHKIALTNDSTSGLRLEGTSGAAAAVRAELDASMPRHVVVNAQLLLDAAEAAAPHAPVMTLRFYGYRDPIAWSAGDDVSGVVMPMRVQEVEDAIKRGEAVP